jgi:hypothetical protein
MGFNLKRKIKNFIKSAILDTIPVANTQVDQAAIINQYRLMKKILNPSEMPTLSEVGFKVHSQFEEDGILLYIFSIIGTTNKRVVEICAGDGSECMATNLILNHGLEGLLFDGNKVEVDRGINFFASHRSTFLFPPIFRHAWLTTENINQLFMESGFKDEIDLLSLDIDGNDYYIMEAIDAIKPRVIICETHNVIPSNLALTLPYKYDFNRMEGPHPEFMGVSLVGMKKLLSKKGYRLVGSNRYGFNAIFMIKEIGQEFFPEVSVESIHNNSFSRFRCETSWNELKDLPWVKV